MCCVICECKTYRNCCFTSVFIQQFNSRHGQHTMFRHKQVFFETPQWHACSLKFFVCRHKGPLSGMAYLVDWQFANSFTKGLAYIFWFYGACFYPPNELQMNQKRNKYPYEIMFRLYDKKPYNSKNRTYLLSMLNIRFYLVFAKTKL
jgi:hypothetical protein